MIILVGLLTRVCGFLGPCPISCLLSLRPMTGFHRRIWVKRSQRRIPSGILTQVSLLSFEPRPAQNRKATRIRYSDLLLSCGHAAKSANPRFLKTGLPSSNINISHSPKISIFFSSFDRKLRCPILRSLKAPPCLRLPPNGCPAFGRKNKTLKKAPVFDISVVPGQS